MERDIGRRNWILIWVLGMAGQICWNVENSWFSTFVYNKVAPDPAIINGVSGMVPTPSLFIVSAAVTALTILPLLVAIDFGGSWLFSLGWAPGGVELALRVTLRTLAAVSCLFFLSMTTPVPQVLRVLRGLRVPAVLTEVSLIIYRDIWMFVDTVRSIRSV